MQKWSSSRHDSPELSQKPELDPPLAESNPAQPPRLHEAGDARLVEQCREGDDDAFAVLVARYEHKLLRVLTRMLNDEELARDLAQETFWKVYTRLDRFDTSRRFGPWLFQVGVNLCLDELRKRNSATAPPPALSLDQPTAYNNQGYEVAAADSREREELAQEVRFILDKLPLTYRSVIVLRDLEGFSVSEIAAIVKKREATVRWRLGRARDQFREHWERRHASPTRRSEGKEANHGS